MSKDIIIIQENQRFRLINLLKAAVYQSEKLNDQLDEMHDILMSNRHAQKAAQISPMIYTKSPL